MPELLPGLSALRLPPMYRVRQRFDGPAVPDVGAAIRASVASQEIKPGSTIAVAVGSRGIANIAVAVQALVAALKAKGANVFIIPAMGSHGGGTAGGQRDVLARLGVTEDFIGAPIRSCLDVVKIGDAMGVEIFMDQTAHRDADLIVPIARVKPHTGFRGRYESGLCKMLAIGLAKHIGCSRIHRGGYDPFPALIPAAAQVALNTGKIGFAVALIENASEQTAHVEAVPAGRIMAREPELLDLAKSLMPRLLLPEIDVLVVEEIGKDISGVGMDSNVTGRGVTGPVPGFTGPKIGRIVVLGLTEKTHGNAVGVGQADLITERLFQAIDRTVTYTNALTSGSLSNGRIPMALPTDDQAILAAASCVPGVTAANARIVRIKNTLHLGEIAVSENLVETARGILACEVGEVIVPRSGDIE